MQNESVFANLDVIQHAMRVKHKVRFRYFKYDEHKNKELQHGGDFYEFAPIRLVYTDGFYYLITYSEKWQDWVNYRVDRMIDVEVTGERRARNRKYEYYDPTEQEPWAFGVFNETPVKIALVVEPHAMSAVIDRFGPAVESSVSRDGKVRVRARVVPSRRFFGWLFEMSGLVTLESPKKLVREYGDRLATAAESLEQ